MRADSLDAAVSQLRHAHVFDLGNARAQRSTQIVVWITLAMMVVEIGAGWWFNSMALLADGWHMSSHALAVGLSALAYAAARRYANDPRFAFGTWKIEVLAGFASAIALLGVAAMMVVASVERLFFAQPIQYREAIGIAILGLVVNGVCAFILGRAHHGDHHGHDHDHGHAHHQEYSASSSDLNLRSAYLHVLADAATSVLAIVALAGGWWYGWSWLDPVMGVVGAALIAVWAKGLIAQTAQVLLDREIDHGVVEEIRQVLEVPDPADAPDGEGAAPNAGLGVHPRIRIADLHVWRVGRDAFACSMIVVTSDASVTPQSLRARLAVHQEVAHCTIEVHYCPNP